MLFSSFKPSARMWSSFLSTHASCFRRMSAATAMKRTVKIASARWLTQSSGNPSPLVKAPTLICWN